MAYIIVPKPGSKVGPCAGDCTHRDCAESRRTATQPCHLCHKQLGYETKLSGEPLAHYACLLKEMEENTSC